MQDRDTACPQSLGHSFCREAEYCPEDDIWGPPTFPRCQRVRGPACSARRWSWGAQSFHPWRPVSAACDGYSISLLRTGGSPGPRTRRIRTSLSTTVKRAR